MKQYPYLLIIALFLIVTGFQPCSAQTSFTFGYDASGNRLNRTIPLKSATIPKDTTEISKALIPLEDQIGLHQIRIYPNPTIGQVRVEIANLGETAANLQIYSIRGSLLQQVRLYGESANIDLGS